MRKLALVLAFVLLFSVCAFADDTPSVEQEIVTVATQEWVNEETGEVEEVAAIVYITDEDGNETAVNAVYELTVVSVSTVVVTEDSEEETAVVIVSEEMQTLAEEVTAIIEDEEALIELVTEVVTEEILAEVAAEVTVEDLQVVDSVVVEFDETILEELGEDAYITVALSTDVEYDEEAGDVVIVLLTYPDGTTEAQVAQIVNGKLVVKLKKSCVITVLASTAEERAETRAADEENASPATGVEAQQAQPLVAVVAVLAIAAFVLVGKKRIA